ncbi:hypothetical protein K402DRAFT_388632 [Aulographum hederae CBS 113979]|uniref:Alpha/beta-hydrolase n=1 Tax=Aulographum hederae CBS 113979 TaxID=1176131 RepID=A0A6G1HGA2_9PEZI|nr:hypothetical protein K402DRAFT_388632 [Aulographum hederae CBS 113979]
MVVLASIATLLALAASATARVCTNLTIPVNISARQGIFTLPPFTSNLDASRFALNLTKQGSNFTDSILTGYQTVTGTYNISAQYCRPSADSHPAVVQYLTHGIGFDKTYWDLSYQDYTYSYASVALAAGYATLAIDRFGVGGSYSPLADPLNTVQAPAEVSATYEISKMLRAGSLPGVEHAFNKVLHVGHSFGSLQTYLLTALHPEISDGIVLTGFSMNGSWTGQTLAGWDLHLARLNQPFRFGNASAASVLNAVRPLISSYGGVSDIASLAYRLLEAAGIDIPSHDIWEEFATTEVANILTTLNSSTAASPGQDLPSLYLTWSDLTTNQFAFLYPGFYDLSFGLLAEATKQPVTAGEIITLGNGAPPTSAFAGPVLVLTGNEDTIYCGGDCLATGGAGGSVPENSVKGAFPSTSGFETYIQLNTGHGINFHYNSSGAYQVIQDWFAKEGLGSTGS